MEIAPSPDGTGDPGSELFDLINYNIGIYNQNLDLAPGILKSLVGDEQILFVITLENGGELYAWGTTEDAEFVEFERLEALSDQEPSVTYGVMNQQFVQLLNLLPRCRNSMTPLSPEKLQLKMQVYCRGSYSGQ